ncbi:class I SAM-dependent methyltransferase [Runella sp.]|jgi:SAM-dependent methyltransferase|uniref:class I SAM-dependent methyltransferase n=1 Tax=Runella sp. TaxID=1960881 RepID=UPI0030196734
MLSTSSSFEFTDSSRIVVATEKPIAFDSPDHLVPWGTANDNSRNYRFNEKVYQTFYSYPRPWKVLDIGCAGGGFVRDCLNDGCFAVGLEGSDYSKKFKRAEWATIPNNLFTCDVTANFDIFVETKEKQIAVLFDLVTSWELMEHIEESKIADVAANVKKHLAPHGLWIMSVATVDDIVNGVNLHQTVKPKEWWITKFEELGFYHQPTFIDFFNTQFVRGGTKYSGPASGSFHLVLSATPQSIPKTPPTGVRDKLFDAWLGSKMQKTLKRWIMGPARKYS